MKSEAPMTIPASLAARQAQALTEALDRAFELVLEYPDPCWDAYGTADTLSAADVIAAARGVPFQHFNEDERAWLKNHAALIASEERHQRAIESLERIAFVRPKPTLKPKDKTHAEAN